ncbi:hypothetical protein MTO96_023412 [Rhipicephalus appendiculatus]
MKMLTLRRLRGRRLLVAPCIPAATPSERSRLLPGEVPTLTQVYGPPKPGQAATGTRADHFSWTRANLVSRAARQKKEALESSAANAFVRPPPVAAAARETPEEADLLATLPSHPLGYLDHIPPLSRTTRPRTHAIFFAVRSGSWVNLRRRLRTRGGPGQRDPLLRLSKKVPRRLLFDRSSVQETEHLHPHFPGLTAVLRESRESSLLQRVLRNVPLQMFPYTDWLPSHL